MFRSKKYTIIFVLSVILYSYDSGDTNFVAAADDSSSNIQHRKNDNKEVSSGRFLRGHDSIATDIPNTTRNNTMKKNKRRLMPVSNHKCGCSTCTEEVLNSDADGFSCGARIDWVIDNMNLSEEEACNLVAGEEFTSVCGGCHTSECKQEPAPFRCGCNKCTESVWNTPVTDAAGTFSCGNRISWVEEYMEYDEAGACRFVTEEFPNICTCTCDDEENPTYEPTKEPSKEPTSSPTPSPTPSPTSSPSQVPTNKPTPFPTPTTLSPTKSPVIMNEPTLATFRCGCEECTEDVWNTIATDDNGSFTCGDRISWVEQKMGYGENAACRYVTDEFPETCTCSCGLPFVSPSASPSTESVFSGTVKVMSYNTEYKGYWDGRLPYFAAKIAEIGADVVGLQECQDKYAIATQSGYTLLTATGAQNYILYNAKRLQQIDSGTMDIPRDNYARRSLTWGKFRIIEGSGAGNEFWFFNTHLPHNHGEASSRNTHARIARMLLAKRIELGAGNSPTVVVGDCNPFASSGASEGSFESNLAEGGIMNIHTATGETGGHAGLDKIFASEDHWTGTGADVGTGRSDHPAIAADLNLFGSA